MADSNILKDFLNQGAATGTKFVQDFAFGKLASLSQTGEKVLEEKISNDSLNGSGPVDADLARMQPQTFEETITGKPTPPAVAVAQSNTPIMLFVGLGVVAAGLFMLRK